MQRRVGTWIVVFLSAALVPCGAAVAQTVAFRTHLVSEQSEFPACAVIDLNRDGKLDLVAGGWWYQAPDWKRHFLRDVAVIRGRYDDYSNLDLDVNGDGRTDLISVNYRSQSLFWIEQPADLSQPWPVHTIGAPGPMETGRLVDIDGDGQLDILPNGTTFAAWWQLRREGNQVTWVRHDLPAEIAGHGIGAGDLNGDGRLDLIGRSGWLEAPVDRLQGRWIWHPDFTLDRDSSIPILVQDVDGDGDSDLIWGRGHGFGLYWLEQVREPGSPVRWTRHAIDTSWSQAHSLLLGDLDGDGRVELIAGSRYLGHEGRDIGEYDPRQIAYYSFDGTQRVWRRGLISSSPRAALGLDPKVADLDGDGDLDLVGADRGGLYWFENLGTGSAPKASVSEAPAYHSHATLLQFIAADGTRQSVEAPDSWAIRREHILRNMERVMGPLPDSSRRVPLAPETIEEVATEKYTRRKITFAPEPGDRVPAYLLIPNGLQEPAPAMLCLHQTTGIGKGEPAGLGGLKTLHYAHELAERGYVCLVPDYPSFGDYPYDFRSQGAHYPSGSMKAIWNNHRAVDLLESLPEVDHDRIGVIGHSLGGHNALFTAAFDQRLKAVATSCGFTAFHHYYEGKLAGWTSDRYMPRIRDLYENNPDKVPFDFYEVLGAIAPRMIYVNAPLHDGNFENQGVRKVIDEVNSVYRLLGAEGRVVAQYPDVGHDFPDAIRADCYAALDKVLKPHR